MSRRLPDGGFFLDAHAARSCPVKTANTFDPAATPRLATDADDGLRESFEGGDDWRRAVLDDLRRSEAVLDCTELGPDSTVAALASGAPLIARAALPDDPSGHRSGRVDLLVRAADTVTGAPGYLPVLTKPHAITEARGQSRTQARRRGVAVRASALATPQFATSTEVATRSVRVRRERDLLQLAHHWRLLEACGHAAGGPCVGGLVGREDPSALGLPASRPGQPAPSGAIVWIDLRLETIRTFSRRDERGWVLRSPMERLDHEHAFRVQVAEAAIAGAPELVRPVRTRECDTCVWWESCRPRLDEDDLSLRIDKAPLDVREIVALRRRGIVTTSDLARADLEALLPEYLPEVTHRSGAERRLRLAAHRADLLARGVALERITDGPVPVPDTPVEIDFDIETSRADRVYLWGFLRTENGVSRYVSFVEWRELDDAGEDALAARAMAWLRAEVEASPSVRVHHFSDFEKVALARLHERSREPALAWALAWAREGFCDLYAIAREHWFALHGLGLKELATRGAGFAWRDPEPNGLASQAWFEEAVSADDPKVREAARRRVLEYNEDDVRATLAVRRWMRASG